MSNFGSPAHGAAMGNAAGMMIIAAGVVGLSSAIGDGIRAAREESALDRYADALERAIAHGRDMELAAITANKIVGSMKREIQSLRAACAQRQEVIDVLCGRA